MEYFDYIFYRVARAYLKWDGNNNTTAKTAVGYMLATIVCDLILFFLIFIYGRDQLTLYRGPIKIAAVAIIFLFMFFSSKRYKNLYPTLDAKWSNEEKGARFYRGILVIIALFLPLVVLILGGIYW